MDTPGQDQPPYAQYPRGPGGQPGWTRPPEVRIEAIADAVNLFSKAPKVWMTAVIPSFVLTSGQLILNFAVTPSWQGDLKRGLMPSQSAINMLVLYFLVAIISSFITYIQIAGISMMGVRMLRGEEVRPSDVWDLRGKSFRIVGATIVMGLVSTLGLVLCCVGYFVFFGLSLLTFPLILDQNLGAMEAINTSWKVIKPFTAMAGVLAFLIILIQGASPYVFLVGILFGLPLVGLITACLYHEFFPSQQQYGR